MQKCHCDKTFVEMIKVQMQCKNNSLGSGNYGQLCINLSHMVRIDYQKIYIERICSQHVI